MKLYTIGFTKKSAREFFDDLLAPSGATRVLDVRARPSSQLSGFAKVGQTDGDLQFLLLRLCDMDYVHLTELAPSRELLAEHRAGDLTWDDYADRYRTLLRERGVENSLDPETVADGVLLCSEASPEYCHRRLAAEYLQQRWGGIEIVHL